MRLLSLLLTLAVLTASGCVSYKELVNFDSVRMPQGKTEDIENALELRIQPRDLLRIEVESVDPLAAAPFNEAVTVGGLGQVSNQNLQLFQGYLVDQDGYIDLPLLGRIEVAGLTVESLQLLVRGKLKTYIVDPVVSVRYLNFKVTVLGEVTIPGVIPLPNSRVTILEALGMAGDLTDYANRSSVLIVREQDGERSYRRLNLQSDEIFASEYYYLKQNDVIYVEPIKARTATVSDPGQRLLSYLTPVLSVAGIVIALVTR
ncbi:polysaccharide export outer membrane protein [Lewinella aquimaris]|uniref:Polysaccharide export outer membrane protein n=1 Tax=Neolewinella aquimaris TaxID=1835722 RepID=A0A840EB63_9BACT|nr:polysaccharide biosynthesis/export family protein [Neolewinella aquimaris]MBB4079029.1 polysaccharide export outer membrane protein [Neolewinella aquimaris]